MDVQEDFKDLFGLLNSNKVEYVVIGGYALAFYGCPRFTADIDVYIRSTPENARNTLAALAEFGFQSVGLDVDDFCSPGKVIQLGMPPVRVDLVTSISGVTAEEAFSDFESGDYGGVPVRFLSRNCLIANKKATARKKDLADLEALGEE